MQKNQARDTPFLEVVVVVVHT